MIQKMKNGDKKAQEKLVLSNLKLVLSIIQRVNIKGVSKKRADVICASSNFMKYFMLYTHSKKVIINNYGIREGIFFSCLEE